MPQASAPEIKAYAYVNEGANQRKNVLVYDETVVSLLYTTLQTCFAGFREIIQRRT